MNQKTTKLRIIERLQHTTTSGMQLNELDGIRAIAVLMVVFYHFWVVSGQPNLIIPFTTIDVTFLISSGSIGVDLFFVLSGFLLFMSFARSYYEGTNAPKYLNYMKRRLLRILPAYYLSIFLVITLDQTYFISNLNGLKHVVYHILFIHNFSIDTHGSINGVFWTLAIEMQFYLILPLISRWFYGKKNIITLPIFIFIAVFYRYFVFHNLSIFGQPVIHDGFNWSLFIYSRQLPGCIDEFAIGMTICNIWMYFKHNKTDNKIAKITKISNVICILGTIAIISVLYLLSKTNLYSEHITSYVANTIIALSFGLLILGTIFNNKLFKRIFSTSFMRIIGILGYSIYIWHLYLANKIAQVPYIANCQNVKFRFLYMTLICGSITLIYSLVFYIFIEKPFMQNAKKPSRTAF